MSVYLYGHTMWDELTLKHVEIGLSIVGLAGAIVAVVVGYLQYRRSEQWKRAEFVAQEMKEFNTDTKVSLTLTMIDWGVRNLPLHSVRNREDQTLTRVSRELQSRALLPHTLVGPSAGSDREAEDTGDGSDNAERFTFDQGIIRDCYDTFLDWFERFGSYLESKLVSVKDLEPYLFYWVNDIAAPARDQLDADWSACLLLYIHVYEYKGVQALFDGFDRDISLTSPRFREFVLGGSEDIRAVLSRHPAVAAALAVTPAPSSPSTRPT
jgi:hypothetical protein